MFPFKYMLRLFVAFTAIVLVILLLPVFLITDDVSIFQDIISYIFNDKL